MGKVCLELDSLWFSSHWVLNQALGPKLTARLLLALGLKINRRHAVSANVAWWWPSTSWILVKLQATSLRTKFSSKNHPSWLLKPWHVCFLTTNLWAKFHKIRKYFKSLSHLSEKRKSQLKESAIKILLIKHIGPSLGQGRIVKIAGAWKNIYAKITKVRC